MPIKTKRWNDPRRKGDGYRLLICRYRPRALPKADETWHGWCTDLAPSKELHAAFYGKHGQTPIGYEEYRRRFLEEMKQPAAQEMIAELAELVAEGKTITLLCSTACTDEAHCHRTLIRQLIEERVQQKQAAAPDSGQATNTTSE
jgi:uncharacterized protein YeaO (DUF488 family)